MQQEYAPRFFNNEYTEIFDHDSTAPMDPQQYARDLARERQHMLAGELSRLDAGEYQNDILEHMMRMDVSLKSLINL